MADEKMKPPNPDAVTAAVLILLDKLVQQTDQVEALLTRLTEQGDDTNALLTKILDAVSGPPAGKVLTSIKLRFKGVPPMPPILTPPIVLTQAGQQVVAEVVGYDQFGQQWTESFDWTLENDNEAAATLDAPTGIVTAVANGVSNITGSVDATDADGNPVTLTDTESVTVNIAAEASRLTTIKVVFTVPAEGRGKKKK